MQDRKLSRCAFAIVEFYGSSGRAPLAKIALFADNHDPQTSLGLLLILTPMHSAIAIR
jgi:hypothetical protein